MSCDRCGRDSHYQNDCYASKHVNGSPLLTVYVLELQGGKYYVGQTENLDKRLDQHAEACGSVWTKKYPPINAFDRPHISYQECFWELSETLEAMEEFGIDNVRGSMFTQCRALTEDEKIHAAQLYCEMHEYCRKCGGEGHTVGRCRSKKMDPWVYKFGGKLQKEPVKKSGYSKPKEQKEPVKKSGFSKPKAKPKARPSAKPKQSYIPKRQCMLCANSLESMPASFTMCRSCYRLNC